MFGYLSRLGASERRKGGCMALLSQMPDCRLEGDEVEMLQRVFDLVCFEARIPRKDARANKLARFLLEEFRVGNTDEGALMECARWLVRRRTPELHVPPMNARDWMARTLH